MAATTDVLAETSRIEKLPYDAQIRAKSEPDPRDLHSFVRLSDGIWRARRG